MLPYHDRYQTVPRLRDKREPIVYIILRIQYQVIFSTRRAKNYLNQISSHILCDEKTLEKNEIRKIAANEMSDTMKPISDLLKVLSSDKV